MIPYNKPYLSGNEIGYIKEAINSGKISGNGIFTKRCTDFFVNKYGFKKCLLTTSCTDALEMCALLIDVQPGDEIIIPSFTFVSTANAFVLRGAKMIFADSEPQTPNLDVSKIEDLISEKTKAIVAVHYAGVACDMDSIMQIADKHNLFVIEDAAQAIDSFYKGKPLGGIGHLGCFSFHETKNLMCGEGGMLIINDERFEKRAEIIWEKGTNRAAFWRGEVDKYNWVDIGSSFLPSEILSAFLFAQLESMEDLQQKRKRHWNDYYEKLKPLEQKGYFKLPFIPDYATNNAHLFYLICSSAGERSQLIEYLKKNNVMAVFHYITLHNSPFYKKSNNECRLPYADTYSDNLLRLPLYYELSTGDIKYIVDLIGAFYEKQ